MHITVTRDRPSEISTSGMLDIDGVFQCYTLEPPINGTPFKAIPDGTFDLMVLESYHFGFPVPVLLNVPGRSNIEIHPGNYPKDTKGCVLVGKIRAPDAVFVSQDAFKTLIAKLDNVEKKQITFSTLRRGSNDA